MSVDGLRANPAPQSGSMKDALRSIMRAAFGAPVRAEALGDNALLAEVGIDSLKVVTFVEQVDRTYHIDFDLLLSSPPPRTVGALLDICVRACLVAESRTLETP